MVVRSSPASRRRKLRVPNTSSNGSPAENPNANMRRLAGSRYTRRVSPQLGLGCGVGSAADGVVTDVGGDIGRPLRG
ncbi:hypothetical protein FQZ97_932910 [compost metagenome]